MQIVASLIMILGSISKSFVGVFQSACSCMKGSARRAFEAKAAIEFCDGSPRRAETIFGWNRKTIQRGLDEIASGKPYTPSAERRGRLRAETQNPKIVESTKSLIDDHSQTDPTFRSTLVYTRVTGQAIRDALAEVLQVPISKLPTSRTMRRILNRNGYSQKKVRKTLPQKKIRQTDSIVAGDLWNNIGVVRSCVLLH